MVLTVDLIRRGAQRWDGRTAVTCGDRSLSYAEVDGWSNRLAQALIGAGAAPQDAVALLVDNGPFSIPLDFACLKARLIRVPLNARLAEAEHAAMLRQTGPRLIVASPGLQERAEALAAALDGGRVLLLPDDPERLPDWFERARDSDPMLPTPPDDIVLALFTSGTTGTLKAARHSQASYAAICANILANLCQPKPGDAMLHGASLIHASGVRRQHHWHRFEVVD